MRFCAWWRHQMESSSALLAICAGNSPVTGEFPTQRPVTRSFDVFDLRLNKRFSKQSWGLWFETPSYSLWRHFNEYGKCRYHGNQSTPGLIRSTRVYMTSAILETHNLIKILFLCWKQRLSAWYQHFPPPPPLAFSGIIISSRVAIYFHVRQSQLEL